MKVRVNRSMAISVRYFLAIFSLSASLNSISSHASEHTATSTWRASSTIDLDITTVLQTDAGLSVFTNALKTSDIWQRLREAENATIFVVPNSFLWQEGSAFLLEEVLIKKENTERLNDLLAQHFVPETSIELTDLKATTKFADLKRGCIYLHTLNNATKVGPEAFIIGSIETNNGYIHFVDRLLWQPYENNHLCSLATSR